MEHPAKSELSIVDNNSTESISISNYLEFAGVRNEMIMSFV